jgi:hypothetical protein
VQSWNLVGQLSRTSQYGFQVYPCKAQHNVAIRFTRLIVHRAPRLLQTSADHLLARPLHQPAADRLTRPQTLPVAQVLLLPAEVIALPPKTSRFRGERT